MIARPDHNTLSHETECQHHAFHILNVCVWEAKSFHSRENVMVPAFHLACPA
jgi:hypothetical protein